MSPAANNRLDQELIWVSGANRTRQISSMPPEHAENAANWLTKHAVRLLMQRELRTSTTIAPDRIAQILADPEAQMAATSLHRALMRRAAQTSTTRRTA